MKLHAIAFILAVVGALNWGLVGLSGFFQKNWNVVDLILYKVPRIELFVYILVGLSGVYLLVTHRKDCKHCEAKSSPQM